MFSWNIIGILIWVAIILYLVFIIQNIRSRRIKMIIKQHKHFSWPNFILTVVEVVVLLVAAGWMFNQTFMDNPDLEDVKNVCKIVHDFSTGESTKKIQKPKELRGNISFLSDFRD